MKRIVLLFAGFIFTASVFAVVPKQSPTEYPSGISPKEEATLAQYAKTHWLLTADIYLWAMNMRGHVTTDGQTAKVSQTFGDTLKEMRSGGMLWLALTKDQRSFFFNGLYANLKSKQNASNGDQIKMHSVFSILAFGESIRVYDEDGVAIEPYLGVRGTINDVTIRVAGIKAVNNVNWWQPLAGARLLYSWTPRWGFVVAGDGAYWGNNNYTLNAIGLLKYKNVFDFANANLYFGYRFMHQFYKNNSESFTWNMNLFGPIAGLSITF